MRQVEEVLYANSLCRKRFGGERRTKVWLVGERDLPGSRSNM